MKKMEEYPFKDYKEGLTTIERNRSIHVPWSKMKSTDLRKSRRLLPNPKEIITQNNEHNSNHHQLKINK